MFRISKLIKLFIVCFLYLICSANLIVKADTPNAYFDYISYYQENSVNEIDSFGNNVLNPVVKVNDKDTTEISILVKNELNNLQTVFYNGDFTNAREIEIIIKSEYKSFYLEILDSNNLMVKASNSNTIKISNLPNGEYYFIGKCYGESYQTNNTYVGYYTVCKLRFNIDCSSPTISGASSTKNKYINTNSVNVKANDAGCGVDSLYMKKPSDAQFNRVGASVTLTSFEDGLYEFYAKDKIGNISNKYYLIYDSKGPTGHFIDVNNEQIINGYTNGPFKFICEDNESGISYSEYKKPNQNEWSKYSGNIIDDLVEGLYQFRAIDLCGNVSKIYQIEVDKTKPKIILYGDNAQISNKQNVACDKIQFDVLDNESGVKEIFIKLPNANAYVSYEIGMEYSLNGTYTLYAYDYAGNRSDSFKVFLDNEPPIIISKPTPLNSSTIGVVEIKCTDLSECMLYVKTPSMSNFLPCDYLTYVIEDTKEPGKYYFYADDILGNKTEVYWINKIDNTPVIEIIRDYEKNTVYIDWENDNYLVTLNGEKYSKKTIISVEGIYRVNVIEDGILNYETEFTIDHLYKLIEYKEPSCEEYGYKRYKCISCSDTYDADLIEPLKHLYKEIYREPTCKIDGGTLKICERCLKEEFIIKINALGHVIEEKIKQEATCTKEGEIVKTCLNCDYIEVHITPKKDHQYILIGEEIVDDIKIKEYECVVCKERYVEQEENIWNKILKFVDYLLDNYFERLVWILLSLTGVWSIVLGIMIIIARKEDDKEKAIRYLRTYLFSLILIFIIFLVCPLLMKGFVYLIT